MTDNQALPLVKIEQFINNIKVLDELAKTQPNIELLKQFQGFGGLKRCFWDKQLYGQLMRAIRANFGKAQEHEILEKLRNSTNSAYYTPKQVINFIYRYLTQVCEFNGGNILEPACGSGAFFEHMPENIKSKSSITGIEYDTLTSKLVSKIYPEVNVINCGLQEMDFNGKKYDLIIGNPPYSSEKVIDPREPDLSGEFTIHHYFVAKCLRQLKDNGILAFVMPSFYMDIPRKNTRHIIDNEGVVIDVIRLPENLFTQATITVDLLILRKMGNKIHDITKVVEINQNGNKDSINAFWVQNKKRVLGELKLKWVQAYERYVPTCETPDKDKILAYLENCEFDETTKQNYQRIIKNNQNPNLNELAKSFIDKINSNLKRLQNLEDQAIAITLEITELKEDTIEICQELEKLSK